MHHFQFGTETSLREKRLVCKTSSGPDAPKPEVPSAPSIPSAPENELQLLIGKLDLEQKGLLRDKIEESLANDGQVIEGEIIAFNNAVREQISKFTEVREQKTLAQIDELMKQLPNNYDNLISYAMSAGLLTQAELANIAFRAGQRNASPGTPERGVEGKVSTEILEQRIENARERMKSFESTRVSMLKDYQANMYKVPRNQRQAYYRKVTGDIRNIRNANGNPVADYWKARKQWEAASKKSYVRHLREKRGDMMADGPETEAASYNYKIVDRNTGKAIASYKQWTGDYIGSGMTRDEAIRIIESSEPVAVNGRNAIIEIDGSQYIQPERNERSTPYDGGIIANAPTDKERARRWSWGVDPLSRAQLDRNRVAARLGINTRDSLMGENISFQRNTLSAAAAGRLEYVNPSGTYAVLNMRRPAGRNTVGRSYPTQIPSADIKSLRLKVAANNVQQKMEQNEMMMRFTMHPEIVAFLRTLSEITPDNVIRENIRATFSRMNEKAQDNLFKVLTFIRNVLITDNKMRPEDPLSFEEKMIGFANIDTSRNVLNTMAEYFEKPKATVAAQKKPDAPKEAEQRQAVESEAKQDKTATQSLDQERARQEKISAEFLKRVEQGLGQFRDPKTTVEQKLAIVRNLYAYGKRIPQKEAQEFYNILMNDSNDKKNKEIEVDILKVTNRLLPDVPTPSLESKSTPEKPTEIKNTPNDFLGEYRNAKTLQAKVAVLKALFAKIDEGNYNVALPVLKEFDKAILGDIPQEPAPADLQTYKELATFHGKILLRISKYYPEEPEPLPVTPKSVSTPEATSKGTTSKSANTDVPTPAPTPAPAPEVIPEYVASAELLSFVLSLTNERIAKVMLGSEAELRKELALVDTYLASLPEQTTTYSAQRTKLTAHKSMIERQLGKLEAAKKAPAPAPNPAPENLSVRRVEFDKTVEKALTEYKAAQSIPERIKILTTMLKAIEKNKGEFNMVAGTRDALQDLVVADIATLSDKDTNKSALIGLQLDINKYREESTTPENILAEKIEDVKNMQDSSRFISKFSALNFDQMKTELRKMPPFTEACAEMDVAIVVGVSKTINGVMDIVNTGVKDIQWDKIAALEQWRSAGVGTLMQELTGIQKTLVVDAQKSPAREKFYAQFEVRLRAAEFFVAKVDERIDELMSVAAPGPEAEKTEDSKPELSTEVTSFLGKFTAENRQIMLEKTDKNEITLELEQAAKALNAIEALKDKTAYSLVIPTLTLYISSLKTKLDSTSSPMAEENKKEENSDSEALKQKLKDLKNK